MTDLEEVTQRLDALKSCPTPDIHTHFSPALRRFRFIPRVERRACADAFFQWANDRAGDAPLKLGCAVFLQGLARFLDEELQPSLQFLTRERAVFAESDDREGLGLCAMLIPCPHTTRSPSLPERLAKRGWSTCIRRAAVGVHENLPEAFLLCGGRPEL